jgi:hypothetical protein
VGESGAFSSSYAKTAVEIILRNIWDQDPSMKLEAILFPLLLLFLHPVAQREYSSGYMDDNSDWWSSYAENPETSNVRAQHRMPAASNFRILGITLGDSHNRDFPDVIARLGNAAIISRGDGSRGRSQICYSSTEKSEQVHLIFEEGELENSFYLFAQGSDWSGSDRCVSSKLILTSLTTASGLHLGQTRQQLEAILGKPSVAYEKKSVYSFEVERTVTPAEFKKLYPNSSSTPNEALVYSAKARIEARFENSKVTYLAVSRWEFN